MNPDNLYMNDKQWDFIYKYYPEYGQAPWELMRYLFDLASQNEMAKASFKKNVGSKSQETEKL